MTALRSVSSILIVALAMTGCDLTGKKRPPEGASPSGATFQVETVKGEMKPDRVDPVFLTPTTRLLTFTVCLIDNLYRKQVANQPFSIWNGEQFIAQPTSQENGCVTWEERPPVNFFARSEYIFQTRIVRGEGASRGQLAIPLAINPWLHGEGIPAVVDLKRDKVGSYNAAVTSFVSEQKSHLWLERLELQNIREWSTTGGRLTLQTRVQLPTQFLGKDTSGRDVIVPISGGRYNLELTLFAETGESRAISVLDRRVIEGIGASRGLLNADVQISPAFIPTSGVYKMGVRLVPVDGPATLGAFEGTFDIASVTDFVWTGTVPATLSAEVYGKSGVYTLGFLDSHQPASPGMGQTTAYFIDKSVSCSFDRVVTETETAIARTLSYRVQYCVRRRDNQVLREGVPIRVHRNMGDVVTRTTNEKGCIDLEDRISHKFYEPECRQLATVRLVNADLGLNETASLQLNPWHAFGTFCRDARIVGPEELASAENPEQCKASRPKSEMFISAFDMNEQKVDYEVDNALNLKVVKTMRLSIYLRATRASNQIDGAGTTELLRQGLYLVRWALVRNGHEDSTHAYNYLDGQEEIMRVKGGVIVHDFQVKMPDPRLIDSRNRFLIEVSTIDERKVESAGFEKWKPKAGFEYKDLVVEAGLAPIVYDANLELKANGFMLLKPFDIHSLDGTAQAQLAQYQPWIDSGAVVPDPRKFPATFRGLADVIAMGKEIERLKEARNADLKDGYAKTQDLKVVTPATPVNEEITYDRLMQAMSGKQVDHGLYLALCNYWANQMVPEIFAERSTVTFSNAFRHDIRTACITNRGEGLSGIGFFHWLGFRHNPFFIFQNVLHVDEAKWEAFAPPGRNYQITIGTQFSMGSRFVNTTDATLRAPIGKIPVVGKILEMGFGLSNTSTWRRDWGNDMTFGTNATLNAEENVMGISVKRYRRCMVIRMNPYMKERANYLRVSRNWVRDEVARAQIDRTLDMRGFMVCGETQEQPVTVAEKYYFVNPTRSPGSQQDPTDLRNRWHSLSIRSTRDMRAFMLMGKSVINNPEEMDESFDGLNRWTENMDELFSATLPSYPGIFLEDIYF